MPWQSEGSGTHCVAPRALSHLCLVWIGSSGRGDLALTPGGELGSKGERVERRKPFGHYPGEARVLEVIRDLRIKRSGKRLGAVRIGSWSAS